MSKAKRWAIVRVIRFLWLSITNSGYREQTKGFHSKAPLPPPVAPEADKK